MTQILCVAGSLRSGSYNVRLLEAAQALIAGAGHQPLSLDADTLRALPLMDQDLEAREGLPDAAKQIKRAFAGADGVLMACPEYNGSITPLLKNIIDWTSRPDDDHPASACFGGKPMALIGASPGGLGGLRGLRHVREILGNLGALVVPAQLAVARAGEAFPGDGSAVLSDERQQQALAAVVDNLLHWVRAARGAA